jgi:hypothetical protein
MAADLMTRARIVRYHPPVPHHGSGAIHKYRHPWGVLVASFFLAAFRLILPLLRVMHRQGAGAPVLEHSRRSFSTMTIG